IRAFCLRSSMGSSCCLHSCRFERADDYGLPFANDESPTGHDIADVMRAVEDDEVGIRADVELAFAGQSQERRDVAREDREHICERETAREKRLEGLGERATAADVHRDHATVGVEGGETSAAVRAAREVLAW